MSIRGRFRRRMADSQELLNRFLAASPDSFPDKELHDMQRLPLASQQDHDIREVA